MQYHKSHNSSGYQIQTGSGGSGGEGTLPRKSLPCLSPTLNQAVKDKKVLPSWKIEKKGVFTYLFYFLFSKSQREETSEPGLETASGFLELEWRRRGESSRSYSWIGRDVLKIHSYCQIALKKRMFGLRTPAFF